MKTFQENRIYDRGAAVRNTVVYAVALAGALMMLFWIASVWGRIGSGVVVIWAIGGLKANLRAIKHGFPLDD